MANFDCITSYMPSETSRNHVQHQQGPSSATSTVGPLKTEVLDAEILWSLTVVENGISFRSAGRCVKQFQNMFPDSQIAKDLTCGERKCAYLCIFGIAPHFKSMLLKSLDGVDYYTIFFDESLNSSLQEKQMDIYIRFYDEAKQAVVTRYLSSEFLGHSTAADIYDSFITCLADLKLSKVLQISMDGPNVNWKFHRLLTEQINTDYSHQILNIGSCGLHTLDNSFKAGLRSSTWEVEEVLKAVYYLFKDAPSRRADFFQTAKRLKMPLQFCCHRWLENVPVTERAIEIWPDLVTYIDQVEKKKVSKPVCKSFSVVVSAVKDPTMLIKLNVFLLVSRMLQPFIIFFQGDKPLLPFFASELTNVILNFFKTFGVIKSDCIEKINSPFALTKIEIDDVLNDPSKICLGFVADKIVKENRLKICSVEEFEIRRQTRSFIVTMVQNILQKSPLNNTLVRDLVCLDPRFMAKSKMQSISKFKRVLKVLVEHGLVVESMCDDIMSKFHQFVDEIPLNEFSSFDISDGSNSLDKFLCTYMNKKDCFIVWDIVKKLLLLSHGQATVERGFSLNKVFEVENLKKETLKALRIIKDQINAAGGVMNISLTKELRFSATAARSRYSNYLENEKRKSLDDAAVIKRKELDQKVKNLRKEKANELKVVRDLYKSADELSVAAEKQKDFSLLAKSNSFRNTAKQKEHEIEAIDAHIKKILDEL